MTCHSLEPLRPWKAEQLGSGYRLSSWVERTAIEHADAVIAVSRAMRDDVLRVYPAVDADQGEGGLQRHRPGRVLPGPPHGRPRPSGRRPRRPHGALRREGHPSKGHHLPPRGGQAPSTPTPRSCSVPAPPTRPRSSERCGPGRRAGRTAQGRLLVRRDAAPTGTRAVHEPRQRVCVPLHLRALRADQRRGDGLWCARRGQRGGRDTRDSRGRRDRLPGAVRAERRRLRHARRTRRHSPLPLPSGSTSSWPSPSLARQFGAAGRQRALAEFTWGAVAKKTVEVYSEDASKRRRV